MVNISENRSHSSVQTTCLSALPARAGAIGSIPARKDNIAAPIGAELSARIVSSCTQQDCSSEILRAGAGLVVLRGGRLHLISYGSGTIAFGEGRD